MDLRNLFYTMANKVDCFRAGAVVLSPIVFKNSTLRKDFVSSGLHYFHGDKDAAESKSIFQDFLWWHFKYGYDIKDYFSYCFPKLSVEERLTYISDKRRFELDAIANSEQYRDVFEDKAIFYQYFNKYMHRPVLIVEKQEDKDLFISFCKTNNRVIIKPRRSHRGIGVEILDVSSSEQIEKAWERVFQNKLIVEKVLKQHSTTSILHPESVNTFRISTCIDTKGEVHIVCACLRMGSGSDVMDNVSGGGVLAHVNEDTGVVDSYAHDLDGNKYIFHPSSNVLIPGIRVPNWGELRNLVKLVARVIPEMRYIGWDFAIDDNGEWELIEGNNPGGTHLLQVAAEKGLKAEFEALLLK